MADRGERVLDMFDVRGHVIRGAGDRHDIEAGRLLEQAMLLEVRQCRGRQSPLFSEVHGLQGRPSAVGSPALDLHEHHGAAVQTHQVEFAEPGLAAPSQDSPALTSQVVFRHALALPSQGDVALGDSRDLATGLSESIEPSFPSWHGAIVAARCPLPRMLGDVVGVRDYNFGILGGPHAMALAFRNAWLLRLRWVACWGLAIIPATAGSLLADEPVDFNRDVRPIFARHCYACHGPTKSEGGLRLNAREAAVAELESGDFAVVPEDPDASVLLERVSSGDASIRMPPEGVPLSKDQIAILRRWIEQGAVWNEHWAFTPISHAAVPEPAAELRAWVRNPIDSFVLARLERDGLQPAPMADPVALIRRISFDVTGLPPTPEDVQAFVADPSEAAYTALVDRLLASPHYGEQWGRHWLDLVRFAETNSFERDADKPHAWRYRDYVIRSFNEDKPFDQFAREQLAGDEIDPPTPESMVATGYYRLGLWDDEPSDPEQLKYDTLDDMVKTTSQVFLGLTLDCARCHDHKIDPLLQSDYYRFLAFFHNIKPMQTSGKNIERVLFANDEERGSFQRQRRDWRVRRDRLTSEVRQFENGFAAAVPPGSDLVPPLDLEQIRYRYFEGSWTELPDFAALKPKAAGWLGDTFLSLSPRLRDGAFGLELRALLRVPKEGTYTFMLDADDGVRLTVDGRRVVERDGLHEVGDPQEGSLELPAGRVPLRLDYFQQGEKIGLELSWSGPGLEKRSLVAADHDRHPPRPAEFVLQHGEAVFAGPVMAAHRSRICAWQAALESEPVPPKVLCVTENGPTAPVTHVLIRGNPHAPAEAVEPGYPVILGGQDAEIPTPDLTAATSRRRLALAGWLMRGDHPLVPRVLANRIWQYHFGRGLVRSPNNFGLGGDAPTHPELLDWLATSLVSNGWRIKSLHRTILLSSTYRMSTQVPPRAHAMDPQNQALSHFDMRRLTAEELRDALLAVSGRLNLKMFGPGFYPEIPAEVLAGQSRPGDGWGKSTEEEQARRSIYIHVKRSLLTPLLESFDLAETDNSCPVRFVTTQPTQALGLINGGYLHQQAGWLADRLRKEAPQGVDQQIERGFRLATGRSPSPEETEELSGLLRDLQQQFGLSADQALQRLCLVLLNLNEFLYLE